MRQYDFPTVGDILDQSVSETLGSSDRTIDAIGDTSLIAELDSINREFIRYSHTKHDNKGWSWMEDTYDFQTKASTALNGAVSAGASSIIVDSVASFVAGGGQLYILTSKGLIDFVTYTSGVSTTVPVTASTVDVAHADGEYVELLYDLPDDFAKSKTLFVNSVPYQYVVLQQLPQGLCYSSYNGSLLLPKGIGAQDCTLVYDKKPDALSTGDETADRARSLNIPKDFSKYAVEMLNSFIFMKRRKRDDAMISKNMAMEVLRDALAYDINPTTTSGLSASW